jgi:hypothetical protein
MEANCIKNSSKEEMDVIAFPKIFINEIIELMK